MDWAADVRRLIGVMDARAAGNTVAGHRIVPARILAGGLIAGHSAEFSEAIPTARPQPSETVAGEFTVLCCSNARWIIRMRRRRAWLDGDGFPRPGFRPALVAANGNGGHALTFWSAP